MIGVFDSGYGGLSILRQMRNLMPEYDYLFLGDNARAPYGPHSFDVVYRFTLQAVEELFRRGCQLVILACNTASAKALRTIQQRDLERLTEKYCTPEQKARGGLRVLGVIRPTIETLGSVTRTRHVGVLATQGTIASRSYDLETAKLWPDIQVTGLACPMWVPLVEYGEYDTPGADYFVEKRLRQLLKTDPQIDTIVLACTHYPHLMPLIVKHTPLNVRVIAQGEYVALSLRDYLRRHPEMDERLTRSGKLPAEWDGNQTPTGHCHYLTTENAQKFRSQATLFMAEPCDAEEIQL